MASIRLSFVREALPNGAAANGCLYFGFLFPFAGFSRVCFYKTKRSCCLFVSSEQVTFELNLLVPSGSVYV
jgi:hypothetical protein